MRKYLTIFAVLFLSYTSWAQNFEWAKSVEGSGLPFDSDSSLYGYPSHCQTDTEGNFYVSKAGYILKFAPSGALLWSKKNAKWTRSLKVDPDGNLYTIGTFSGEVDLDPGPGVSSVFSNYNSTDVYLSKWTPDGNLVWAKTIGNFSSDEGYDLALDTAGNIYFTGKFQGTMDFDPGPGTYNLTSYSNTDADIFVAKWDNSGNIQWAQKFGNHGEDFGSGIVTDTSGNVYITGIFYSTSDFNPGAGIVNLNPVNGNSFLLKLDGNGNYIWAKNAASAAMALNASPSLVIDTAGNLYLSGTYFLSTTFDPGTGIQTLNSAGGFDGYLAKYTNAGNFLWVKRIGGPGADLITGMYLHNDGALYFSGFFEATADLDPGPGTLWYTAQGPESDAFVLKLKPDHSLDWVRQLTGSKKIEGNSVAILPDGRVKSVGDFLGTADFDPGSGIHAVSSSVWGNIFVSTLDSSGNFMEAEKISELSSADRVQSLTHDADGNTYSTGFFRGTLEIEGTESVTVSVSEGDRDIFVSKRDSTGRVLWSCRFGGTEDDGGRSITVDSIGNVYVTGYFTGTAHFAADTGTVSLSSAGRSDIFILKLSPGGNLLWVKRIGGTSGDRGNGITQDRNGNILSVGYFSQTTDFDPGPGNFPVSVGVMPGAYILKLDSDGNFIWVKTFSGNSYGNDIVSDSSGNIYTTGYLSALIADMDPGPGTAYEIANEGDNAFISKLDTDGNYVWGKLVGGRDNDRGLAIRLDGENNVCVAGNFQREADLDPDTGSYILTGTTSGIDHAFLLKLDTDGHFLWAVKPGGAYPQDADVLSLDPAGNIYSTGAFDGSTDFDPGTGVHLLESAGGRDIFVSKLDTGGNRVWTLQFGDTGEDEGQVISVDQAGTVYMAGSYSGETDFDPGTGTHILNTPLQFDGSHVSNLFYLRLGQDLCSDMAIRVDSTDHVSCTGPGYAAVHAVNGNAPYAYTWNRTPLVNLPGINIPAPGIYPLTVTDAMGCTRNLSLLIDGPQAASGFDFDVTLSATTFRPGFMARIWPEISNDGCVPAPGVFKLALSPYLTFLGAVPAPDSQTGDTLFWNIDSLQYGTGNFAPEVNVRLSASAPMGNHLHLHAFVLPPAGDADSSNNVKDYAFPILNGYDPNDKQVYPKGQCIPGYVPQDQLLTYTVRFQNTGNADAVNIHIIDSLPPGLDLASVRVIRSSHPMYTEVLPGKKLKFVFDAIHLPDSTSDEPGSHGHVVFEARPLAGMPEGTALRNSAAIYFDYNPPVITNEVLNTLSDGTYGGSYTAIKTVCGSYSLNGVTYTESGEYRFYLSDTDGCDSTVNLQLTVNRADAGVTQNGFTLSANAVGAAYQWIDCESSLPLPGFVSQTFTPQTEGNYAVHVVQNGCTDTSACFFVAGMGVGQNGPTLFLSLYPNPAEGSLTLSADPGFDRALLRIIGSTGQVLRQETVWGETLVLDVSAYPPGIYLAEIVQGEKQQRIKWIKR